MTSLYGCRSLSNGSYQFVKFDEDLRPLTVYKTSAEACTCPAGVRSTCRHREMLRHFLAQRRVDTTWLCEFPAFAWRQYIDPFAEAEYNAAETSTPTSSFGSGSSAPESKAAPAARERPAARSAAGVNLRFRPLR